VVGSATHVGFTQAVGIRNPPRSVPAASDHPVCPDSSTSSTREACCRRKSGCENKPACAFAGNEYRGDHMGYRNKTYVAFASEDIKKYCLMEAWKAN